MNAAPLPAAVVAAYPADCRPTQARPVAGGFSDSRIWRCLSPRGELAIRAWPEEQERARIAWIHRFQSHLAAHGAIPVPAPLATSRGETFVAYNGRVWDMANWLAGEPLPAGSHSPVHRQAACMALAQLHRAAESFESAGVRHGPPPAALRRREELRRLTQANCAAWPGLLAARGWPELSSLALDWTRLAPHWLPIVERELAMASDWEVPLQACLRDVWSEHILFVGNRVNGMIDFGAAGWDSVACDLARLVPSIVGDNPSARRTAIADYSTVRPLSEAERRLIEVLDRAAMLMGPGLWFRWIADEERDFRDRQRVVERVADMISRLAQAA